MIKTDARCQNILHSHQLAHAEPEKRRYTVFENILYVPVSIVKVIFIFLAVIALKTSIMCVPVAWSDKPNALLGKSLEYLSSELTWLVSFVSEKGAAMVKKWLLSDQGKRTLLGQIKKTANEIGKTLEKTVTGVVGETIKKEIVSTAKEVAGSLALKKWAVAGVVAGVSAIALGHYLNNSPVATFGDLIVTCSVVGIAASYFIKNF